MAVAALVAHYRDQQRARRPAGLHEPLALEQHIVLAVTPAGGNGPIVGHPVELDIRDGLDLVVDRAIDRVELRTPVRRGIEALLLLRTRRALARPSLAEIDETIGCLRRAKN